MKTQTSARRRTVLTEGRTLLVQALPVAILVMVVRFVLHDVLDISGIMGFGDAGAVLTDTARTAPGGHDRGAVSFRGGY